MGHDQHPLLRFRQQHLVGSHACFALRHQRQIELDARARARGHLARRRSQAGGAHVLNAGHGAAAHRLETSLEQKLFEKGISDLNGGTLGQRGVVKLGRGHRGAVNTVAARLCAHIEHRIADARRFAKKI